MNVDELINHIKRIKNQKDSGAILEVKELTRIYLGSDNSFFKHFNKIDTNYFMNGEVQREFYSAVEGLIRYLEHGLQGGISLKRQVQIDIVSDFLEQAESLLNLTNVHCAAPTVVIGAALEEFLRNWIENDDLKLVGKKPCIDSYAKILRENEKITKQDSKDITSWAGLRNYAAHGEWEEVSDKNKISIMLQAVNLFIRKYS